MGIRTHGLRYPLPAVIMDRQESKKKHRSKFPFEESTVILFNGIEANDKFVNKIK